MLGLLPHCWADLAGISGEKNIYLGSGIIIIIYPALSAAIRGRHLMDGSRAFWMTLFVSHFVTVSHLSHFVTGVMISVTSK